MPWLQTWSLVPYKLHIYDLNLQMVCSFESFYELDIELDEEVKAFGKVYETKLCCLQASLCMKWKSLCRWSSIYKMTSFSTHRAFRNATLRRESLKKGSFIDICPLLTFTMAKKDFQDFLFIESARRPFLRLGRAVLMCTDDVLHMSFLAPCSTPAMSAVDMFINLSL